MFRWQWTSLHNGTIHRHGVLLLLEPRLFHLPMRLDLHSDREPPAPTDDRDPPRLIDAEPVVAARMDEDVTVAFCV